MSVRHGSFREEDLIPIQPIPLDHCLTQILAYAIKARANQDAAALESLDAALAELRGEIARGKGH